MRQDVVEAILQKLSNTLKGKKIESVIYDEEVQEFYIVLEDGLKINV